MTQDLLNRLQQGPLIGRIFAAALVNERSPRDVVRDAVEDAGRAASLELERFLTTLGTIATISPLLGLFGTVVGMIEIFGSQNPASGGGNPRSWRTASRSRSTTPRFGIGVAIPR